MLDGNRRTNDDMAVMNTSIILIMLSATGETLAVYKSRKDSITTFENTLLNCLGALSCHQMYFRQ